MFLVSNYKKRERILFQVLKAKKYARCLFKYIHVVILINLKGLDIFVVDKTSIFLTITLLSLYAERPNISGLTYLTPKLLRWSERSHYKTYFNKTLVRS